MGACTTGVTVGSSIIMYMNTWKTKQTKQLTLVSNEYNTLTVL